MKALHLYFLLTGLLIHSSLFAPVDTKKIPELLKSKSNIIPVAVIGAGPAGLAAAIPAVRSGYHTVVFQGPKPGGELTDAQVVENWPAVEKGTGASIMKKLESQVRQFGAHLVPLVITAIDFSQWPYKIELNDGTTAYALTVICATGSTQRKLGVDGESLYWGKGIFSCGLCDGSFTRGKDTVVVGGGDFAVQRALQLVPEAKNITIIAQGPALTAHKTMQNKIKNIPKISVLFNKRVRDVLGTEHEVTHIDLYDIKTGETLSYPTTSVFLSMGLTPNTELFKGKLPCEKDGCLSLKNTRSQQTPIEGVMAAGTVSDPTYRQVAAITGDATKAGMDAVKTLSKWGFDGELRELATNNLYKPPVIPHPLIKHIATLREYNRIIRAKKPVLVEFYSPSCTSCATMEGPLTVATEDYKSLLDVYKVDKDSLYELVEKYDINLIPAFFLFKNGKELKRMEGENTLKALRKFLKEGLKTKAPQTS